MVTTNRKRRKRARRARRITLDEGYAIALKKAGSQVALAQAAGVTKQAIQGWTRVPAERAKAVSAALDIPLNTLRPDLW